MLFLSGKLKEEDLKGYETSNWGSHYMTQQQMVVLKKISFGRYAIKNVEATICNRYGGPMLFGVSCLDKLHNYSIKETGIYIEDDSEEVSTYANNNVKRITGFTRFCKNKLKILHKERELHPEEDYKYDYTKWCFTIYSIINCCYKPIVTKKKWNKVIPLLEELRPLIQNNLDDDEKNPKQRGAFITAYFYFYLASAYYQADRRQEALDCYEKAKTFFLEGTSTLREIEDCMMNIRKKLREDGQKEEPKLEPIFDVPFEDDVVAHNLHTCEIIDECYGNGEKKTVWTGFNNFQEAFDFSINHRKRLEVIKRVDGEWYRTGNLPTGDFSVYDLELDDNYIRFCSEDDIEKKAKEMVENHDSSDEEFANIINSNKDAAIKALLTVKKGQYDWKHNVILKSDSLAFEGLISPGGSLQWHDIDYTLCVMEVDPEIAQRLVADVLAGKFIPCALGQMPEDFLFLHETTDYFRTHSEDDYTGNNDPDYSKWIVGHFVVMDDDNSIGYSYRETYDNVHWRWQSGEHSNQCGLMESGKDINKNVDYKFCYWQLVRNQKRVSSNIMNSNPF